MFQTKRLARTSQAVNTKPEVSYYKPSYFDLLA
jgi:hypothetical protein